MRGGRWLALWALAVLAQGVCAGSALAAAGAPQVSSVSPNQGSVVGGERVTITGSGFAGSAGSCSGVDQVTFGSDVEHGYAITSQSFQVTSDTQISAVVPPNFGGLITIMVHNSCGWSPMTVGSEFTYKYPSSQCLSGTCSISTSSAAQGALRHAGVGFLDGFNSDAGVTITPAEAQLVRSLHPLQWRLGQAWLGAPWGGEFALARSAGAQVTLDLTSDWRDWASGQDPANVSTPYGDLSTYYTFIYNDVKQRIAANEVPDYFDVWNEPMSSGTVNQWLSVYGTAYQAIKAADPSAQVEGPSIDTFLATSGGNPDTPGYELSLTDFLNWEMTTGDRFAAISWHEDGTTVGASPASPGPGLASVALPGGYRDFWSPTAIATHVKAAKTLLAGYPALAGTKVFVNEYGPTFADNIPGWMVGDFQALETAGADQGMLTCPTGAGCDTLLDGLIGADGSPQMPYWVMNAYSQMTGSLVGASSSGSNLYTLATRVDTSQTVEALVGRADDCFGGTQCPQFHASQASPVNLSLSVAIPWALKSVNVSVQTFSDSATNPIGLNDVPNTPATTVISGVAVKNGIARFTIPAVDDGDALYLTVSPAASTSSSALPKPSSAPKVLVHRGRLVSHRRRRRSHRRARQ